MTKKITIKDIANEAGVSIGTVDRALNNRSGISLETKERVLKIAKDLNYQVNRSAQSLARKTIKIGCILPYMPDYFYPAVEKGIHYAWEELKDYNIQITIKRTPILGVQEEIKAMEKFMADGYHGITLCAGHRTKLNTTINKLVDHGIPVITISNDAPESKRTTCVSTDSFNNGEIAGSFMAKMLVPESQIMILTGSNQLTDNIEKVKGFKASIAQSLKKLHITEIYETFEEPEKIKHFTKYALNNFPDLRGIYITVAGGFHVAPLLQEIPVHERPVFVATDLSRANAKYVEKELITLLVYQQPELQGYRAINLLFDILIEKKTIPPINYVRPEFVVKENLHYYLNDSFNHMK